MHRQCLATLCFASALRRNTPALPSVTLPDINGAPRRAAKRNSHTAIPDFTAALLNTASRLLCLTWLHPAAAVPDRTRPCRCFAQPRFALLNLRSAVLISAIPPPNNAERCDAAAFQRAAMHRLRVAVLCIANCVARQCFTSAQFYIATLYIRPAEHSISAHCITAAEHCNARLCIAAAMLRTAEHCHAVAPRNRAIPSRCETMHCRRNTLPLSASLRHRNTLQCPAFALPNIAVRRLCLAMRSDTPLRPSVARLCFTPASRCFAEQCGYSTRSQTNVPYPPFLHCPRPFFSP